MPNIRGGKSYKKSKEKTKFGEDDEVAYIDVGKDQMVGRLVKLLGNLNATVYCQDNKQRLCKICRSIKKSVRFEVGDVVLVSLRDCEVSNADQAKGIRGERGDILDKFHPKQFKDLKESGINSAIFATIDSIKEISSKIKNGDLEGAQAMADNANEDIFDRSGMEDVVESEDSDEDLDAPQNTILPAGKVEKKDKIPKRPQRMPDEDVDVDNI